MSAEATLEIHVHVEDGRVIRFLQNDPTAIEHVLHHIHPTRLFSQNVLMIGSADSLTAFQSSMVVRVDFVCDCLPDYPFYNGVLDIQQISVDEFRERYKPQTFAALRESAQAVPDHPITVFSELELVNGERLFMQVCVKLEERLPLEQGLFVQQVFSAHGLHARRHGGGVIIVNPANIVRFTFYPAPPALPPGSLQAGRLIE